MIFWRGLWFLATIVFFSSLLSRSALAASNDAEAGKLREAAIYQDYLATDFPSAEKKLSQALALCSKRDDCSSTLRARLYCDLGVVEFASQKPDAGRAQFVAALKEDPAVAIDPDLTTPELQREFAAAKGLDDGGSPLAQDAGPLAPDASLAVPSAGPLVADAGPPPPDAGSSGPHAEPAPAAEPGNKTEKPTRTEPTAPTKADSDCPPGFPGCKSGEATGATCTEDDECGAGERCVASKCEGSEEASGPGKANWVSLAFQTDFLLLPSKNDVCRGGQGYSCFNSDGTWYSGNPIAGEGGAVASGGLVPATMGILAAYDRNFGNLTGGAAVGFAFGNGPTRPGGTASIPVHAELRGKYWFGHHPLARKGFRFYALLAGGIAEVDGSITAYVNEPAADGIPKTAWRKTGTGFAAIGLGTMFAFTPTLGLALEARGTLLFPTAGEALSGQLSFAVGF
ncbi:MAG: hypothetical protein ABSC94_15795 [Polyangiaceae bacterium]